MKPNLFVSQLENEDLGQFPYLKEQTECAADNGNLQNMQNKSSYFKSYLKVAFLILLKKKTAYSLL